MHCTFVDLQDSTGQMISAHLMISMRAYRFWLRLLLALLMCSPEIMVSLLLRKDLPAGRICSTGNGMHLKSVFNVTPAVFSRLAYMSLINEFVSASLLAGNRTTTFISVYFWISLMIADFVISSRYSFLALTLCTYWVFFYLTSFRILDRVFLTLPLGLAMFLVLVEALFLLRSVAPLDLALKGLFFCRCDLTLAIVDCIMIYLE